MMKKALYGNWDTPTPEKKPAPKPSTSLSAYDLLGIAFTAFPDDIRSAFRRLVKQYHPDVAGESGREMFEDIQDAYKLLSDPKQKKKYDAIRKLQEKKPATDFDGMWSQMVSSSMTYVHRPNNYYYSGSISIQSFVPFPPTPPVHPVTRAHLQNLTQLQANLPPYVLQLSINQYSNAYGSGVRDTECEMTIVQDAFGRGDVAIDKKTNTLYIDKYAVGLVKGYTVDSAMNVVRVSTIL